MKEKILARFKEKFPGVNLSKARLNAIAAKIEGKVVDDETKIDAALDELNTSGINTFAEIAKEDDRVRGIEAKHKQPATPKEEEKKDPPKDDVTPPADDTPAWAKKLMDEVTQLRSEKVTETFQQQRAAKLKDVPEIFWKKLPVPKTTEELEQQVTEITADHAAYHQTMVDQGLSIKPPKSGSGGSNNDKKVASKEELDAVAKQIIV
jgi:hypothetical protein